LQANTHEEFGEYFEWNIMIHIVLGEFEDSGCWWIMLASLQLCWWIMLALSIKMSQLGHYETTCILGMCIGNVVHEQNPVKMTSLTRFRMLELYFKNP
jgi:hypothetical protein